MTVAKPHANAADASQPQGNTPLALGASSAPSSRDTVDEVPRGDAADVLLRAAYPGERKRASATRWLGWLAYQMRDDKCVPWRPLPSGAQDLWRLQPWPGGALAVARTIGAGILLVLLSFLAICGCLLGFGHGPDVFSRWADEMPDTLERALLRRPLAHAVAHRVLVQTDDGYTFSGPALRACLAARHQADLDARAGEQASRAARTSGRTRLLAFLDDRRICRISYDVAAGTAVYLVTIAFADLDAGFSVGQAVLLVVLLSGSLIGVQAAVPYVRWTVASIPGLSRADATTAAALAATALAALIIWSGPALAAALAAVLPAAFVAACGLWACLLTHRAPARHRARSPLLYLPDAIAASTIGIAAAVLVRRSLLTTEPATVLLFPIATWGSLRAWRAMNHARRLTVRAAADLTLSLLLGAELILFAVWLANLLGLSRAEVSVLRAVVDRTGRLADVPWWTWATVYLILAGTSVALGRWPGPLRRVTDLLRVAPAVGVTRRVLTGVHIALLVIVFVAVAGPSAVTPLLRHQISARYDVALQRELEAARILDAYSWIRAGLVPVAPGSGALQEIVVTILNIGGLSTGDQRIATESDLAQRLGRLQAMTLTLSPPPGTSEAAGDNVPSLDEDLGRLDAVEQEGDATLNQAEKIGEYVAAAVASTISIANVSDHEVVQIVREYLSGLIEESPLKDIVAAWYRNIRWRTVPPPADEIVDPDAARLEKAASAELDRTAPQGRDVTNTLKAIRDELPAIAAVELTNATRYAQEETGPCDSICRLAAPPGAPDGPVVNPPEPVDPEPVDPFGDFPH